MDNALTFRSACKDDHVFLRDLYASSRDWEMQPANWDDEQKRTFLHQQFELQSRHYRKAFKRAAHHIIVSDDQDIGRLVTDRTKRVIHIIDITLLPDCRGNGLGTKLLQGILAEAQATNRSVKLKVRTENTKAQRLYFRLNFETQSIQGGYIELLWIGNKQ